MDECPFCGTLEAFCTCDPGVDFCIKCGKPLPRESTDDLCETCLDEEISAAWDSMTQQQQDRVVLRNWGW